MDFAMNGTDSINTDNSSNEETPNSAVEDSSAEDTKVRVVYVLSVLRKTKYNNEIGTDTLGFSSSKTRIKIMADDALNNQELSITQYDEVYVQVALLDYEPGQPFENYYLLYKLNPDGTRKWIRKTIKG